MATRSVDIPGIEDLLVSPYRPADPRKMADAAANARAAINPGIAAIGELLWQVSSTKELELDPSTAFNIGVLLKMLSDLNQSLETREISGYQHLLNPDMAAKLSAASPAKEGAHGR